MFTPQTSTQRSLHLRLGIPAVVLAGLLMFAHGESLSAQAHSRLVLQIHSVKCIDETNGVWIEKIGGDEMVLSGIAVDAAGRASRVPTLRVGHFKKDNEVKRFAPARSFASFDLGTGPAYPRKFQGWLVLVERDEKGGFQQVVDRLVAGVNAGNGMGTVPKGSARALSANDIDVVLNAVSKGDTIAVVKAIGGTVLKKLGDDVFPPRLVVRTLKGDSALFSGKRRTTAVQTVSARAHGGKYEVTYSWRLEK